MAGQTKQEKRLIDTVLRRVLRPDAEFQRFGRSIAGWNGADGAGASLGGAKGAAAAEATSQAAAGAGKAPNVAAVRDAAAPPDSGAPPDSSEPAEPQEHSDQTERSDSGGRELADYLLATPSDPYTPEAVFPRLRWGGQFVFASASAAESMALASEFAVGRGFVLERGPQVVRRRFLGVPWPWGGPEAHFFVARKVQLLQAGQVTDRFTFDVQLVRERRFGHAYVVLKQIPTYTHVVERLKQKYPQADLTVLVERVKKLVDRVFPVFLTREAAFLNILQRDLPPEYRHRVPRVLATAKGPDGLVHKLYVNWLRLGPPRLSQLEFARQSADLLRVLHDRVGIIHLDLRLDNFVITRHGVGFVDFGSAVRQGEDLSQSPMLRSLFDEMMSTSQIQRSLGRMCGSGMVTSSVLYRGYQKLDKAADLFYLAVQMIRPHANPDFRGLVRYDPAEPAAKRLAKLTRTILRPEDPAHPPYASAAEILRGIERIGEELRQRSASAGASMAPGSPAAPNATA